MKIEDVRIGASETSAPLGLSSYRSPFEWYMSKVGQNPDDDEDEEGEAARLGKLFEAGIAQSFEEEHGVRLDPNIDGSVSFAHPEFPWMQARPDRVLRFEDMTTEFRHRFDIEPGEHVALEVKTTGLANPIPRYIIDERWGAPGSDVVPVDYATQVQQQINVMDAHYRATDDGFMRRAILKALIPGQGVPEYNIHGDMKVRAWIGGELQRIVRDHLLPEVPLPATTKDDFELLIKARRQPGHESKIVVPSDANIDALVATMQYEREMRDAHDAAYTKAKATIIEWIGTRYGVEGPWGKLLYTLGGTTSRVARKNLVDEAVAMMTAEAAGEDRKRSTLAKSFLALVQKHTKTSTQGRALRPYFKKAG